MELKNGFNFSMCLKSGYPESAPDDSCESDLLGNVSKKIQPGQQKSGLGTGKR